MPHGHRIRQCATPGDHHRRDEISAGQTSTRVGRHASMSTTRRPWNSRVTAQIGRDARRRLCALKPPEQLAFSSQTGPMAPSRCPGTPGRSRSRPPDNCSPHRRKPLRGITGEFQPAHCHAHENAVARRRNERDGRDVGERAAPRARDRSRRRARRAPLVARGVAPPSIRGNGRGTDRRRALSRRRSDSWRAVRSSVRSKPCERRSTVVNRGHSEAAQLAACGHQRSTAVTPYGSEGWGFDSLRAR